MYFVHKLVLSFLVLVVFASTQAHARGGLNIIRDSEIETYFKEWGAPLIEASQIPPGGVNVILVQSDDVNAFVAGGANIFFYTGLIQKTDGPGELMGVFAHELGHIAGGHLIAQRDALERASYESILGTVIGLGAAVLSGNGGAGTAIISGTQNVAQRKFLAHSRVHESAADQAALSYFEEAEFEPEGLVSFLEKLRSQELLPSSKQAEYVRTHPLTSNRIEALQNRAKQSPYEGKAFPKAWYEQHARMQAKLVGFISPGRVAWEYDDRDTSIPAEYARAIAAYQEDRIDEALEKINALIALEPDNPYFHELKGQMLVEFSRVEEGLSPYRKAIELKPREALFRIAYGHALIESANGSDQQGRLSDAINQLNIAKKTESRSSRVYRLLATAYGRLGDENAAKLNLAEEAVLQRRLDYARELARGILSAEEPNSPLWVQARDLLDYIKTLKPPSN